eukprot:COSAG06_NODE_3284_length_5557_cov_6.793148_3_plen_66_part_00
MWATDSSRSSSSSSSAGEEGEGEEVPVFAFERPGRLLRRLAWGTHPECEDWIAVSVDDTLEVVHV